MELWLRHPGARAANTVLMPSCSSGRDLHMLVCRLGFPTADVYLKCNGRLVGEDEELHDGAVYSVEPRLVGGKGGFGSMLRALGAQIEKTTNREACRDLSGRRLRDVNHEKAMAEWIKKQAERETDKEQRRLERLQRRLAEPKHYFTDPQYEQQLNDMSERLEDSVLKGLQATSSDVVAADGGARKRACPSTSTAGAEGKRRRLWMGVKDLDEPGSSDEECTAGSSSSGPSSPSDGSVEEVVVDEAGESAAVSSAGTSVSDSSSPGPCLPKPSVHCSISEHSIHKPSADPCIPEPSISELSVDPGVLKSITDPGVPEPSVDPGIPELSVDPGVLKSITDPGVPEPSADPDIPELGVDPGVPSAQADPGYPEISVDPAGTDPDVPDPGAGPDVPKPAADPVVPEPLLAQQSEAGDEVEAKGLVWQDGEPPAPEISGGSPKEMKDQVADGGSDRNTPMTTAAGPEDWTACDSAEELEGLGLERLKNELLGLGLKCGGTLQDRAARLFSVRGLSREQMDPSLFAKPARGRKK
ncbi:splicing regulator SDE2 [Leucoraja erinacea]|uniref:splicing regulator SDE2 n=1 Tax=Leucoraja erinaceus TaxID=7782 RepID=UPI0024561564|nr:splicing regulator SDE2 [Leucoraja erinacea]